MGQNPLRAKLTHLCRQIEQYAYGSEGHREPEEEWAPTSEEDPINLPDSEEGEKQERGVRNTWEYPVSEDKNYLFLTKQVAGLEGNIKDLLEQTRAESAKDQGNSLRQKLTYRVLKDELVHARLKAQVAEEAKTKEEEEEAQKIRSAKHTEDNVLQVSSNTRAGIFVFLSCLWCLGTSATVYPLAQHTAQSLLISTVRRR